MRSKLQLTIWALACALIGGGGFLWALAVTAPAPRPHAVLRLTLPGVDLGADAWPAAPGRAGYVELWMFPRDADDVMTMLRIVGAPALASPRPALPGAVNAEAPARRATAALTHYSWPRVATKENNMELQESFADLVPAQARRNEYEFRTAAAPDTCKSCGAAVVWIHTSNDHAVPLSVSTAVHRNGRNYALSHFLDCPQASEWGKG